MDIICRLRFPESEAAWPSGLPRRAPSDFIEGSRRCPGHTIRVASVPRLILAPSSEGPLSPSFRLEYRARLTLSYEPGFLAKVLHSARERPLSDKPAPSLPIPHPASPRTTFVPLSPETNSEAGAMKSVYLALLGAAHQAASHATFQALWVDGVDMMSLLRPIITVTPGLTPPTPPSVSAPPRPTTPSRPPGAPKSAATSAARPAWAPSAQPKPAAS